jgi:ketosteroid isomerase-like protein
VAGTSRFFGAAKKEEGLLMTLSTLTMLDDIYDAWRTHNLDLLATYLPSDFSHFINIPTELHPLGEVRHGKQAVLERLGMIFAEFDTQRFDIGEIALNGGNAVAEVQTRCRHRESGALLEITKSNLWTLEGGRPVKLFEHYDLDRFKAFMQAVAGTSPGR